MKPQTGAKSVAAILCMLSLASCGVYSFNPSGKSSISTIAIEPFENQTDQYGLADLLTEVVVDAFIAEGSIKIVPAEHADAVLIGTLKHYERAVERYDEFDQVQEYKVVMDFEITLRNPTDQSDIWTETMRQEGTFEADTETEEDGQRLAGARLVEAVINRTTKAW